MADEVVGEVRVDVHGNTEPLKSDIRRAATEAGQTLDAALAEGTTGSTTITDNIVGQIGDAEKPSEEGGKKVGRAIRRGVGKGIKDGGRDTDVVINTYRRDLDRAGTALGEMFGDSAAKIFSEGIGAKTRQRIKDIFSSDVGSINIGGGGVTGGDKVIENVEKEVRKSGPRLERVGKNAGESLSKGMRGAVSGGIFDAFFKILAGKVALLGAGISFAIRAAAPAIVGLTGQVAVLGTGLAGLGAVGAASFATMLPAVGALKLAFTGMDKEASKAFKEKITAAAGDLGGFKERVRNEIIPSLVDATKTVSKLAPEINKLGTDSAKAGGRVAKAFASMFVGRKEEIGNIFGNAPVIMEKFGNSGSKAVGAIINALDALQPLVMKTVDAITVGMDKMSAALNRSVDSGRFTDTMTKWYDRGVLVLQIFKNLGLVVGRFFGAAADSSDDFLTHFEKLTQKWADWMKSAVGKNVIKQMFDDAVPVINEVWGLLGDIAGLFKESFIGDTGGLVDFIKSIRENIIPGIEELQGTLRDSGIQDALYDFGKALLGLFQSGGGTSFRVFVETLTLLVNVAADLTNALGPLLVPLTTFFATMRGISIAKSAVSSIATLPALLTNLLNPTKKATDAITDLNDAADGLNPAPTERATGRVGRAVNGMADLIGKASIVYAGLVAVSAATVKGFDDSAAHITEWSDKVKDGLLGIQEQGEITRTWVENGPARLVEGLFNVGGAGFGARTAGEELAADLGTGFLAKWKQFSAGIGIDFSGVNKSKDAVIAQFEAIAQAVKETGDTKKAQEALDDYTQMLEDSGISADVYADALDGVATAINRVVIEQVDATKNKGLSFEGNFKNAKTALESMGTAFDQNVLDKIDKIKNDNRYKDPLGGFNPEGVKAISKIYEDAFNGTINGVKNALSSSDLNAVKAILGDKKNFDEFGELTEEALKKIAGILPKAIDSNKAALRDYQRDLAVLFAPPPTPKEGTFATSEKNLKTGRAAIRQFIPEVTTKDTESEVERELGSRVFTLRAKLQAEFPDALPAQIEALLAKDVPQILVDIRTEQAEKDLEGFIGPGWKTVIEARMKELGPGSLIDVDGQLLEATEDGKYTAIIGAEAEKAALERTQGKVYEVVKGKNGEGYTARIKVTDNGTADETSAEIDDASRDRTTRIKVTYTGTRLLRTSPITGDLIPDETPGGHMILPPPVSSPSTISPGGPTTMGYANSLAPAIGTRASLVVTGAGMVGSRNTWTGKDEPVGKSVTVNNYYPKPERASDTVAMSLRVARYS